MNAEAAKLAETTMFSAFSARSAFDSHV